MSIRYLLGIGIGIGITHGERLAIHTFLIRRLPVRIITVLTLEEFGKPELACDVKHKSGNSSTKRDVHNHLLGIGLHCYTTYQYFFFVEYNKWHARFEMFFWNLLS